MAHILIVDDEREMCALIARLLDDRGHSAECASSGEGAIQAANELRPDLVLLDMCLGAGGIDGIETLRRLRSITPSVPIVMMTAFGNVQAAVHAMKAGATDFVSKPFNNQALLSDIEVLLAIRRSACGDAPTLVGESLAFRKAMDLALRFAVPDINILLVGETGTGKELFARTIHAASKRRNGPFVAVDCSTLAENLIESELFGHERGAFTGATSSRIGRLELAQGGTLFLDEIGNLPAAFQAKLLRVLQERRMERVGGRETIKLDSRVVSATNVNLKGVIAAGEFRQDLYYRLQEMTIGIPPLRERNGDIGRIARYFVALYAERFGTGTRGISDGALEAIEGYEWPGNVRELENAIKSAIILSTDVVLAEDLPPQIRGQTGHASATSSVSSNGEGERLKVEIELGFRASEIDLKALGAEAVEQAERSLLTALLRRGCMKRAQMAKLLSVDPKTLRTKLRRYGLETGRVMDG
ncbi:MAG: sigma-54-dependent Fis family transcriptional regulator [Planctomycetes bacterium]|nr:sigma-54-dependent Fis family transcriptional regulator [Planctomycetota bacterium]